MERLPVPLLHQEDGGRYLGTYGFHVVRSPDGEWTSWSVARTMLRDRTTVRRAVPGRGRPVAGGIMDRTVPQVRGGAWAAGCGC
ncbi:UbiD family decarboxylase domain-containing protein [Kitasatospora sp. NPDC094011]|uniref:UbiD family decarboxylase domain-containing protein n=1 Tax=Kitasatospora sp. NPDC094011 TaxID=3364090 RepID=UPI003819B7A3